MNRALPRHVRRSGAALACGLCVALAGCGGRVQPIPIDPARERAEVQAWHQRRVAELEAPDSWLSLVGLAWLHTGVNTIGSDSTNDVVLPDRHADAHVGRVIVADTLVRFVADPGVVVTRGVDSTMALPEGSWVVPRGRTDEPRVTDAVLGQVSPGRYTVLRNGPVDWLLLHRADRWALRIRDDDAPAYRTFHGIAMFPVSLAWRVTAKWVPRHDSVAVTDEIGTVVMQPTPATLEFFLKGARRSLTVTGGEDDGRYMIVFGDQTNGSTTYGGGRFLWVAPPDAQGRVVVDFNYAYNPPCAYTAFATCPLPPAANRLALRVDAGEKAPAGH